MIYQINLKIYNKVKINNHLMVFQEEENPKL